MQATHSPSFEAAFSRNSDPSSQEHQGLDSRGVLPFDELRKDLRRAIASAKAISRQPSSGEDHLVAAVRVSPLMSRKRNGAISQMIEE